jgi:cytochrome P450 / NADPH-cytochrome P450 reductase
MAPGTPFWKCSKKVRACIGRPFAWQEATIVTAMILQRFTLSMEDPEYSLKIKQTLTIKPLNFAMRVKIRPEYEANRPTLSSAIPKDVVSSKSDIPPLVSQGSRGRGVLILYGSNSGSCEGFAHNIGEDAGKMGFDPITVASLDDYAGRLPTKLTATIIVTCSYEGKPADNARDFVSWVEQLHEGKELEGVKYFVFGCGHKDWVDTYQRIPRLIDEKLSLAGATRIFERGEANAAGDFVGDFDSWRERVWQKFGTPNQEKERQEAGIFDVEVVAGKRQDILRLSDLQLAKVVKNQPLVETDGGKYPMKRHIEIELPDGMTYLPGNYLQVLPTNGDESVSRALTHFGLTKDDSIVIKKVSGHVRAQFPTDAPVNAQQVFECYIELSAVASRNQIKTLLLHTTNEFEKAALEKLADGDFEDEIMKKRVSVVDLLVKYPSIKLPLGTFLEISTPMRVRQYSISSSANYLGEGRCSLTVGVLTAPAKSGLGIYKGISSS